MGSALKKSVYASEQLRPDVATAREQWRAEQPILSRHRLIFLDETGVTTNMVRRYGRAPRGKRVVGYAPNGHWKITTFLAGLTSDGIVAPVIDEPMNRTIFTEYVRQFLVPELRAGDIVILDNLSSHKGPEAIALVEERGAKCSSCRPIAPISTQSKWPSQSSKASCEKPQNESAIPCGAVSDHSRTTSQNTNVKTTCVMLDMIPYDHKPL
jgi:hypothetical protein